MNDFYDLDEVLGVLQGFNPWWSGQASSAPQFRRLAYMACRRYLDDSALKRAILLSGPRRVGKSTILFQVAEALLAEKRDPRSVLYLSLDHPLLKLLSLPKILDLYHERIFPEGQSAVLLLDEVQYAADWDLQLKQLVDHKPQYRILATGSASVTHKKRLAESGVGRWVTVPIPTLSFYEFIQIQRGAAGAVRPDLKPNELFELPRAEIAALAAKLRPLKPLFTRYLLVGGFPETAGQKDVAFCQRLLREDVVERVLKRDMTALFGIRNVTELEKLFIYLCLHSGGIFAAQKCAAALQTSVPTVNNHLEALVQANLIYRLPPAGLGGKSLLKARPKLYLVDAALRNAVLLRGEEILKRPEEMGVIVETAVLRHLYAYYYRDTPRISYWRDAATTKEVDLIVQSPAYVIPVEVKYRDDASLSEQDGIVLYARSEKAKHAYWITRRDEDFMVQRFKGIETKFLKIPAHVFCYLIGQAERLLWK